MKQIVGKVLHAQPMWPANRLLKNAHLLFHAHFIECVVPMVECRPDKCEVIVELESEVVRR